MCVCVCVCMYESDAHSEEMVPKSTNKVIIFMPEGSKTHLGGTMRCGLKTTVFNDPKCISTKLYGADSYVYNNVARTCVHRLLVVKQLLSVE